MVAASLPSLPSTCGVLAAPAAVCDNVPAWICSTGRKPCERFIVIDETDDSHATSGRAHRETSVPTVQYRSAEPETCSDGADAGSLTVMLLLYKVWCPTGIISASWNVDVFSTTAAQLLGRWLH